jgi:hypothetical protein
LTSNMDINQGTMMSHVGQHSLLVDINGGRFPIEKVKQVLFKFALWKQEAGQPVTSRESIELTTSLIKDKPTEIEVQAFQK